jgi:phage portal protein BeeE
MTGGPAATPANGGGVYDWVTSSGGGWFGPGTPMSPAAPGTAGRRWDYPTAINQRHYPKRGEGVTFGELRALADAYDLLRLVIETRKDEMEFVEWKVQDRAGKETPASRRLMGFLASPDREHTWHQWQRMLLEELFVTDAPAIYLRRTYGGDPFSLETVDGGTIKKLLDETGRTPIEGPAYQQVLHGVVTANFDRTELLYCPRNVRVNRVYGYSPVEQVITTVNIALRRQAHQLSYYTEGSVPDLMFQVPEGWDAKQIQEFQTWWASLFAEGNIANRRMARFVPHGVTPFNTKEAALKDQYDEWLARIICFAFSVSPQALIAQMNKATAEVAEETAKSNGLEPIKNWLKGVMDRVLAEVYGEPGLEFVWLQKNAVNPTEQAQIHATYIQCGVMDVNEVREAIGLEARKDSGETSIPYMEET